MRAEGFRNVGEDLRRRDVFGGLNKSFSGVSRTFQVISGSFKEIQGDLSDHSGDYNWFWHFRSVSRSFSDIRVFREDCLGRLKYLEESLNKF